MRSQDATEKSDDAPVATSSPSLVNATPPAPIQRGGGTGGVISRPMSSTGGTMLNPALSEDILRNKAPVPSRSIVSGILKDSAIRSVSALLSENGTPMNIAIEEQAKAFLDELMNDFITDVAHEAYRLTKKRKASSVHAHDLGIVLNKKYGLNVPGSNCGAVLPIHPNGAVGSEHARKLVAVRRKNSQASKPRKQNVYNS
eukprot:g4743.t1